MAGMTRSCGQCHQSISAALHYCPNCGFDQDVAAQEETAPAVEQSEVPPSAPPPSGALTRARRQCVEPDCGQAVPLGAAECPYCGAMTSDEGMPDAGTASDSLALLALPDGALISVPAEGVRLGRDPDFCAHAGILAAYANVSRRHALVSAVGGRLSVSDLDSTNGTFLNGVRLTAYSAYALNDGDELRMGATCALRVVVEQQVPDAAAGSKSCG